MFVPPLSRPPPVPGRPACGPAPGPGCGACPLVPSLVRPAALATSSRTGAPGLRPDAPKLHPIDLPRKSVERLDRHGAKLDRVVVAGEAEKARGPVLARVGGV